VGASAAETVNEIERIRTRLDAEVRELERRLPASISWVKRGVGAAVGGGAGGTALFVVARRLRRNRKRKVEQRRVERLLEVPWESIAADLKEALASVRGPADSPDGSTTQRPRRWWAVTSSAVAGLAAAVAVAQTIRSRAAAVSGT